MSARGFGSVVWAGAVAGAALGFYLVSLRVASERAALEDVESNIAMTQRDIRTLRTEIGTRFLSAGSGVEERAVLGAQRLSAKVRFVTASYLFAHLTLTFLPSQNSSYEAPW